MWYVPRPRHRNFSGLGYLGGDSDEREAVQLEKLLPSIQEAVNTEAKKVAWYGREGSMPPFEDQKSKIMVTDKAGRLAQAASTRIMYLKQLSDSNSRIEELRDKIKIAAAKAALRSVAQEPVQAAPDKSVSPLSAGEQERVYVSTLSPEEKKRYWENKALALRAKQTAQKFEVSGGERPAGAPQVSAADAFVLTARDLGDGIDQLKASGNKAAAQERIGVVMNKMYSAYQTVLQARATQSATESASQAMDNALNFGSPDKSDKSARAVLVNFARDPGTSLKQFNDRAGGLRAALMDVIASEQ